MARIDRMLIRPEKPGQRVSLISLSRLRLKGWSKAGAGQPVASLQTNAAA